MTDRADPTGLQERDVFFVSDGTGITAETLGLSVLAQFDRLRARPYRISFVDSPDKAREAVVRINDIALRHRTQPIVFSTLVDPQVNQILRSATALILDVFETFLVPLEVELDMKSSHAIGRFHALHDTEKYKNRIEAINFALTHDDGQMAAGLQRADVILVGVSRCGKTPTSLYLAMQYGLKAANYPLIPEDFERGELPSALPPHKQRIFGLTISAERLAEVRRERRPNSRYASLENCLYEVTQAERLMRREGIRWLSSTTKSIEEIAATILQDWLPERRDNAEPGS